MSLRAMLIASPMPRVPPVTIATRAMFHPPKPKPTRLGRCSPSFKFAADQLLQHGHPFGRVVEAIEPREMRAAGSQKRISTADAELLQRFEAVCGKSRRCDGDALDVLGRISRECRIR